MIRAEFYESQGKFKGFSISGHAGFANRGYDIVCAAVSSAVEMTANLITDGFNIPAEVSSENDAILCEVDSPDENSDRIIKMLSLHLGFISDEFPNTITITNTEISEV